MVTAADRALFLQLARRMLGFHHPDVEDVAQRACLDRLTGRTARDRGARLAVIDAIRCELGRLNRRGEVMAPSDRMDLLVSHYATDEHLGARLRREAQEDDDRTLRAEWSALPLAERQARIIESCRALGSSCPDMLGV